MKTPILLMATLLGLAVAATQAQTQSSTTTTYVQTSKIVGMKVKDSSGQEIGVVKDVVLDRNSGCMAYTVLSTGGTSTRVTGGGKTVAVPWSVYTTTSDPSMMTVRVERDRDPLRAGRIDGLGRPGRAVELPRMLERPGRPPELIGIERTMHNHRDHGHGRQQ